MKQRMDSRIGQPVEQFLFIKFGENKEADEELRGILSKRAKNKNSFPWDGLDEPERNWNGILESGGYKPDAPVSSQSQNGTSPPVSTESNLGAKTGLNVQAAEFVPGCKWIPTTTAQPEQIASHNLHYNPPEHQTIHSHYQLLQNDTTSTSNYSPNSSLPDFPNSSASDNSHELLTSSHVYQPSIVESTAPTTATDNTDGAVLSSPPSLTSVSFGFFEKDEIKALAEGHKKRTSEKDAEARTCEHKEELPSVNGEMNSTNNSADTKQSTQNSISSPTSPQPPAAVQSPLNSPQSPALSVTSPQSSSVQRQISSPNTQTPSAGSSTSPAPAKSQQTTPSMPKPASWAGLFTKDTSPAKPSQTSQVEMPQSAPVEVAKYKPATEIGAILSTLKLSQGVVPIQPTRLINRANWCYVNATLQALVACPPFYHMLKALPPQYPALGNLKSVTPVLDAMIEFVNQFTVTEKPNSRPKDGKTSKNELKQGVAMEPTVIYEVLRSMKSAENMFQRGRQEDAEEFLICLLNTLHEEIGEAIKQEENKQRKAVMVNGNGDASSSLSGGEENQEEDAGGDWLQVLPKNKSVVTHSNVDKLSTPISQMFVGQLRSSLSTTSSESDTLEPFFTVPLNVQTAPTVEEALRAFVSKESIEGYTDPKTKEQTDAHRRLTFERMPNILILHLKCFVYDKHGGSLKVNHSMSFSENLEFDKDLLSPHARTIPKNQKSYKLFAVVYHSGEKTTGGHYHTDVFHTAERRWIRFDDDSVKKINSSQVFETKRNCVPYLLYYKRLDTMQSPSNQNHSTSASANK